MQNSWKPDLCVYHGDCNDGFGAAWAVWNRWGYDVEYVPAHYGSKIDADFEGKRVLFVDFSMKREHLRDVTAREIVVLDHHKTAQAELEVWTVDNLNLCDVPDALDMREQALGERIVALFDMDKSGARLAWEFCHADSAIPELLAHVEDRDLWRFNIPGTKEVHAALNSYPHKFELWSDMRVNDLILEGAHIMRAQQVQVGDLCKTMSLQRVGGHLVPAVNAPFFLASDVGHALLRAHPDAPFTATWCEANRVRMYSLRSEDHRTDVSEIARSNGGGGHRNAAGFSLEVIE